MSNSGTIKLRNETYKFHRHLGANSELTCTQDDLISDTTAKYDGMGMACLGIYLTPSARTIAGAACVYGKRATLPNEAVWFEMDANGRIPHNLWLWFRDYATSVLAYPPASVYCVGSIGAPVLLSHGEQPRKQLAKFRAYTNDHRTKLSNRAMQILEYKLPDMYQRGKAKDLSHAQTLPIENGEQAYALCLEFSWYGWQFQKGSRIPPYAPRND